MAVFQTSLSAFTRRKTYYVLTACALLGFGLSLFVYYHIRTLTNEAIFSDSTQIKPAKVALVLGTSRYVLNKYPNEFFVRRMEAAAKLYQEGKVQKLLLSGDNSQYNYNEPEDMRQSLLTLGVPDSAIVLDFAGFRTYDSVVRAKEIFGQTEIIVVSQRFHLERALFIAQAKGIAAQGLVAADSRSRNSNIRVKTREVVSRLAALLDCYVLHTQPKFLGKKEMIS